MNGSLFDKFLTYTCNNPGTLLSFCTNNTEDRFINDTSSNTKTVTFSSRNARLGNTGYCKKSPVLIYNDLDGIDTIQITDVKGYVCARSANGVCSDNALVGCMAGFKHSCASGTQGTIGIYDVNNKLLKEYTIAQVKNGVDVPAGGKKAYVYFKDSFYDDNNGAFKCSFKFTKTKESSCNIECSSDADCGTILKKVTLDSDHFGKSGAFRTLAINEGLTADIYHHFGNTRATGERVCALTEKYQTALGLDRPYTTFISKQPYTFVTCGNDWN